MIKRTVGKRIFSILLAALLALTAVLPASSAAIDKMADVHYPYVFVHGMGGWGADEGINDLIPYWGATTGALMPKLRENGYECYDASVGPISSCWDRACELYAQMVGDTVDYGEAHAKAHNHARYGRTYTTPLFDGWGKSEKNGVIKKVNLVGHTAMKQNGKLRLLRSYPRFSRGARPTGCIPSPPSARPTMARRCATLPMNLS